MKQSIYNGLFGAIKWYQNEDTAHWPDGLSFTPLAPDAANADQCDNFSGSFFARRKSVPFESDNQAEIKVMFYQSPLGDCVVNIKFCNQIKFTGIKAADAQDLSEWATRAIEAAKSYAIAILNFMNLSE